MKIRCTLIFSLILLSFSVQAQKKIKEYYDNGNLKFEGKYTYTWKQDDFLEIRVQELPKQDFVISNGDELEELNKYRNILPTKAYDGFCRFYYPEGQKFYEGNYINGIPAGNFTYWHKNGTKSGELNFLNGMADGIWQIWQEDGKLLSSFSYKAIPQDTLAALYNNVFFDNTRRAHDEPTGRDRIFQYLNRNHAMEEIGNDIRISYSKELKPFREVINKMLFKTSIWDGKFIVNEGGTAHLEFYYSNNKPSGTWKLWKDGQLYFECNFKDGKALTAKKYEIEERDGGYGHNAVEMPLALEPPPVESNTNDPGHAVEAPVREEDKVFTYVQQMPEFPGGPAALTDYISKNIVYPQKAREAGVQGRAMVQLVINEDGSIDEQNIKIVKSLSFGTDEEIVRMVKNMPRWQPGKQNGKAVKTFYSFPVRFSM